MTPPNIRVGRDLENGQLKGRGLQEQGWESSFYSWNNQYTYMLCLACNAHLEPQEGILSGTI